MLAWRARDVSLLEFEILLAIIGIGFGGMPPLSATVLQNSVSISTFGTAVATMQFSRNLYCTMMVAAFGAIVLTGPLEAGAARLFGRGLRAHLLRRRRQLRAVAARRPPGRGEAAADHPRLRCYRRAARRRAHERRRHGRKA